MPELRQEKVLEMTSKLASIGTPLPIATDKYF